MKKVSCILLSLFLIICLVGCIVAVATINGGVVVWKARQINENENVELNSKDTDIRFWTDEETGVQYVIYNHGAPYKGMGGITPRLNADGTLYIDHPTEKGGEEE